MAQKLEFMKALKALVVLVSSTAIAVIFWASWNFGWLPNLGLEAGYYAQFNRTKHAIQSIENFEIRTEWMHQDLVLEDFGFTPVADKHYPVEIEFSNSMKIFSERNEDQFRDDLIDLINSNRRFQANAAEPRG